jgi:hypothetical protein
MITIILNKYKKVSDFCYKLFGIAEIPLYFSKFSNKMYSNFQKLFLLVYKQYRKFTYEELFNDLEDNLSLKTYLGLNKLPDYTTLIKFCKQLPKSVVDKLVNAFRKIFSESKRVAIDSTGISLDNASTHYCKRIGLPAKKRPFMKSNFVVDIDQFLILLCSLRKSSSHDSKDAKPLIKKLAQFSEPEIFYADRGYDDEKIFKLVFEELGAYPLIMQRRQNLTNHRRQGYYRKKTFKVFDYGEYLQRNKVETCISMLKRRFGSNSRAKTVKTQKIEILLRIVAFNIDRLIRKGTSFIVITLRILRVSY